MHFIDFTIESETDRARLADLLADVKPRVRFSITYYDTDRVIYETDDETFERYVKELDIWEAVEGFESMAAKQKLLIHC